MLISHRCKFIYLKTAKTAGTSVEIYFEPYCTDPQRSEAERHEREEEVSQWGIIGSRLSDPATWYNHMPAAEIRSRIGENIWREYFRFCAIRNPFDRVVSLFWFSLAPPVRVLLREAEFSHVRRTFQIWAGKQTFPDERPIFWIDGMPAVHYFVRFERLHSDLEEVCRRLAIPWMPERLGRFKSEYRLRRESFREYYDSTTADIVARQFGWELDYFGYLLDGAIDEVMP